MSTGHTIDVGSGARLDFNYNAYQLMMHQSLVIIIIVSLLRM